MSVSRPINVLVVGECGDGKSTLIDGLRDKSITDPPRVGKDARGVTKEIKVYPCPRSSDGVQINLVDTPGVGDHDITPMALISLIETALAKGALGEDGIRGVVVTTPIPDGRIKLGAQVVQALVEKGFIGGRDGEDKWHSIILCGTKHDRAEPEDVQNFIEGIDGKPSVSNVFYDKAGDKPGQTVMVSRGHYDPLVAAIKKLPAACILYQQPSVQEMSAALAARLGIEPSKFEEEMTFMRDLLKQQSEQIIALNKQMLEEQRKHREEIARREEQASQTLKMIQEQATQAEQFRQKQLEAMQEAQRAQTEEMRRAAEQNAQMFQEMINESNARSSRLERQMQADRESYERAQVNHRDEMREMMAQHSEQMTAIASRPSGGGSSGGGGCSIL